MCSRRMTTDLRLVQNITMAGSHFKQFVRLSNQLVPAADNFGGVQSLSPIQKTTRSKDVEEHVKLVHKVVDVMDRKYRKICVTLLR